MSGQRVAAKRPPSFLPNTPAVGSPPAAAPAASPPRARVDAPAKKREPRGQPGRPASHSASNSPALNPQSGNVLDAADDLSALYLDEHLSASEYQTSSQQQRRTTAAKRQQANFLLNFSFTPPPAAAPAPNPPRSRRPLHAEPFSPERFRHANFRFVVHTVEQWRHMLDPDHPVDWDAVAQVFLPTTEPLRCAICFEEPTPARITRCGHVFCWPCILHHLSFAESGMASAHRCPLCFVAIHSSELRPVVLETRTRFAEGVALSMTLMQRERGATVSLPRHLWSDLKTQQVTNAADSLARYYSILLATPAYLAQVHETERSQLRDAASIAVAFGESDVWIQHALSLLPPRKGARASTSPVTSAPKAPSPIIPSLSPTLFPPLASSSQHTRSQPVSARAPHSKLSGEALRGLSGAQRQLIEHLDPDLDPWSDEDDVEATAAPNPPPVEAQPLPPAPEPLTITPQPALTQESTVGLSEPPAPGPSSASQPTPADDSMFYVFQAVDGQRVFLHPLNVKMLLQHFGSHSAFPDSLTATIIELEHHTQTAETRKRFRAFSHLPLSCSFWFAEVDLTNVVSHSVIQAHSAQLRERHQKRVTRTHQENLRKAEQEHRESVELQRQREMFVSHSHTLSDFQEISAALAEPASFPSLVRENSTGETTHTQPHTQPHTQTTQTAPTHTQTAHTQTQTTPTHTKAPLSFATVVSAPKPDDVGQKRGKKMVLLSTSSSSRRY